MSTARVAAALRIWRPASESRPAAAIGSLLAATTLLLGCGAPRRLPRPAVFEVDVARGLGAADVATGFALGPGQIVTVAHVLGAAGIGARVRLRAPLRSDRTATVTAIDERDDLALLAVPNLRARRVITAAASGDAVVLALRGRRIQMVPAHVRRSIMARIRTPDGSRLVRRPALELSADIRPGDSGAPVLTPDGRVSGVLFARADVQSQVAYAVDASALSRLRAATLVLKRSPHARMGD